MQLFVEVVSENVDAVRAGEVVELVTVEIGNGATGGRLQERAALEVLLHVTRELERHAVARRELHVRDAARHFLGQRGALRKALCVNRREPHEAQHGACEPLHPAHRPRGRTAIRRTRRTARASRTFATSARALPASDVSHATARGVEDPYATAPRRAVPPVQNRMSVFTAHNSISGKLRFDDITHGT